MGYYSFVVVAKTPVGIPDPVILLDTGVNVFTAHTDDLPGLLALLREEGVEVQKYHRLDAHEPVTPQDMFLPGEIGELELRAKILPSGEDG